MASLKVGPLTFAGNLVRIVGVVFILASGYAHAQLFTFPKQELIDYTAKSPFDRFPDGRPKVPDSLIERARGLSAEEVWATLHDEKGFRNQWADGFQVLHPGKTMNEIYGLVRVNDILRDSPSQDRDYVIAHIEGGGLYGEHQEHDPYGLSRRARAIGSSNLRERNKWNTECSSVEAEA